ncbi:hypothetical protein BBR47_57450 [Brevibacillus brevis NBRC 100599]|uniref:Uncharacterized protein n=1 Tax=Brevibacillus brevis (strain 47 / JCM 6285 / NBRC 100599) TaxID=358681 RepID=C0Z9L8_BREBN|nr:hypothetical protein [Brevibacillus brevis]BAH46722.1 hypothetical protein BBR47_57450 [Brevibacillus brevis NBRC 100599]
MKKLAVALTIFAVSLVGSSSAFATEPVAESKASVTAVNSFSQTLAPNGKSGYTELYEFYVIQQGNVTVDLTQQSTAGADGSYVILSNYGPDQWVSSGNPAVFFTGNGSFSFTTTKILQPGHYALKMTNRTNSKVTVNGTITSP